MALNTAIRLIKDNPEDSVEKISQYVARSMFYPEKFNMLEDSNIKIDLIKELDDNAIYNIIRNALVKTKYNIFSDKKAIACEAFEKYIAYICTDFISK